MACDASAEAAPTASHLLILARPTRREHCAAAAIARHAVSGFGFKPAWRGQSWKETAVPAELTFPAASVCVAVDQKVPLLASLVVRVVVKLKGEPTGFPDLDATTGGFDLARDLHRRRRGPRSRQLAALGIPESGSVATPASLAMVGIILVVCAVTLAVLAMSHHTPTAVRQPAPVSTSPIGTGEPT